MVVALVDKELGGMAERTYGSPDVLVESLDHFLVGFVGPGHLDQVDHFSDGRNITVLQESLHDVILPWFRFRWDGLGSTWHEATTHFTKICLGIIEGKDPDSVNDGTVLKNLSFFVDGHRATTSSNSDAAAICI